MKPALVLAVPGACDGPEHAAEVEPLQGVLAQTLPDVRVMVGFINGSVSSLADAVREALGSAKSMVVVPLLTEGDRHGLDAIIARVEPARPVRGRARRGVADDLVGEVAYTTSPAGDPRLSDDLGSRLRSVTGADPSRVASVVLGPGVGTPEGRAAQARAARLVVEQGLWGLGLTAFLGGTARPDLIDALTSAVALGFREIVVGVLGLGTGGLHAETRAALDSWRAAHTDVDVRLAPPLTPTALAAIVADRYRSAARFGGAPGAPVHLVGLALAGRRVVVVGGGAVASRRVPRLLADDAAVVVVAPRVTPELAQLAAAGALTWRQKEFTMEDLQGARYVQALTDEPQVNARVAAWAEAQGIFCVRGDDASGGTAWTPASGTAGGLTIGVVGHRNPRRSAAARDVAVAAVESWDLTER